MRTIMLSILMTVLAAGLLAADKVQDFKLEDINGDQVSLSGLLEKGPVVISFWATWCKNCKKEMPELDKLQEKYKDRITVVCISVDKPAKKEDAIRFVKNRFQFVTLLDPDMKAYKALNAQNPPHTFIINSESEVVFSHVGYQKGDEEHLEEEIVKLLETKPETTE